MRADDAFAFLRVHHAAVRELAAADYPLEVLEEWAPLPVTEAQVAGVQRNPDGEDRFVAELEGAIVGIGALVAVGSELRACYVAPEAARRGVGTALVGALERAALSKGVAQLVLDSSLTARRFYEHLGYEVLTRGEHVLGSGRRMACLKMRKTLESN